jgi:phosphoribosyl-ATP pyrophosphohydrolase
MSQITSQLEILLRLQLVLAERRNAAPDSSYVAGLYAKGTDGICKKIAEEAAEAIMAAKDGDKAHLVKEITDLWFHSMVLMAHFDVGVEDVAAEFLRREGISGIEEKQQRANQS